MNNSVVRVSLVVFAMLAGACGGGDATEQVAVGAGGLGAGGSGSAGTGGMAGSQIGGSAGTGGSTAGGSAGTSTGGTAGSQTGGSAGTGGTSVGGSAGTATGGTAGSAGTGGTSTGGSGTGGTSVGGSAGTQDAGQEADAPEDSAEAGQDAAPEDSAEAGQDAAPEADASVCAAGTLQCVGAALQQCKADQTGWSAKGACATAQLCQDAVAANQASCPAPACAAGQKQCAGATLRTCNAGQNGWDDSACVTAELCQDGLAQGACAAPACGAGEAKCVGAAAMVCNAGQNGWTTTQCQFACVNAQCSGVCSPSSTRCSGQAGNALQTCQANGQWDAGTACSGNSHCSAGACVTPASCNGLNPVCGSPQNKSCCPSNLVPGGTFHRSYDGVTYNDQSNPATVSDFKLDVYEVTVERFANFIKAGKGTQASPPAEGDGANPHVSGSGWQSAWNASLTTDAPGIDVGTALRVALKCASGCTWNDNCYNATCPAGPDRNPINNMTWYEAFAFCAWDGGRLPTEAEWNYAAAGGSEQRAYPWSVPSTSMAIDSTYATYGAAFVRAAGYHSPKGDGKWGHADLAGNVAEWTLDEFESYMNPCVDCADVSGSAPLSRSGRGGGFSAPVANLLTSRRGGNQVVTRYATIGVRCARNP